MYNLNSKAIFFLFPPHKAALLLMAAAVKIKAVKVQSGSGGIKVVFGLARQQQASSKGADLQRITHIDQEKNISILINRNNGIHISGNII